MERPASSPDAKCLTALRHQIAGPGDRTLWACLLEATAVKAGNVHPTASFADLTYQDFQAAAFAIAPLMEGDADRLGELVLAAVQATRRQCHSNVNLGMILLLAPLTLAARRPSAASDRSSSARGNRDPLTVLRGQLAEVLAELDASDGALVFQAIREAEPGGLGEVDAMDVRHTREVDLGRAMEDAAERDLIARQYASDFALLFEQVVPTLRAALWEHGDWLEGIRWGQVSLLAAMVDTLIARKCGQGVAGQASERAGKVLQHPQGAPRERAWRQLDQWLRDDGHRRNPGAIADLIAAGIWILLSPFESTH